MPSVFSTMCTKRPLVKMHQIYQQMTHWQIMWLARVSFSDSSRCVHGLNQARHLCGGWRVVCTRLTLVAFVGVIILAATLFSLCFFFSLSPIASNARLCCRQGVMVDVAVFCIFFTRDPNPFQCIPSDVSVAFRNFGSSYQRAWLYFRHFVIISHDECTVLVPYLARHFLHSGQP